MMDATLAFGLGAISAAAATAPLWFRFQTRHRDHLNRAQTAERRALAALEVLNTAPGGMYLWRVDGMACASRRLAVLLDLKSGLDAGFNDVLDRFDAESRKHLEEAAEVLRRDGKAFEITLQTQGRRPRRLAALGERAGDATGRAVADVIWFSDAPAPRAEGPARHEDAAQFRAILDLLPVAVWVRDAELKPAFANKACHDGPDALMTTAKRLAERAQVEGERQTGSVGALAVTEVPVRSWGGTLGFALDQTVSADAPPAGLDEGSIYQVLDNLSNAIAIFDADHRLAHANHAFARLWGLDAAWLSKRPALSQLLDALRAARKLPEVADYRAFKAEQNAHFSELEAPIEERLFLPDGRTLNKVSAPHPGGGLIFAYEDVTDRLDLERSYRTLGAVQQATLDNLHEGVAVFGSDGRLKLGNPALAGLWDLETDRLTPDLHLADFIEMLRPNIDIGQNWEGYKERILTQIAERRTGTGELRRRDGKIIDYMNVPLPDEAVLITYLDVTDRACVEDALRTRTRALEEADRLKSAFISNVSFELRTPLTALIGFADLLAGEYFGTLSPRQREYAEGIRDSGQSLERVINDILDLAGIEAGTLTLSIDTVELHSALTQVLSLVRERARHKGIRLEFDCPADVGWLVADEKRLKQVIFNLLSNAIRFTPPRGIVRLAAWRNGEEVGISVSDTGSGIPRADQERIFRAFERGKATGDGGGAGLGLTLVKSFVGLHRGKVDVQSGRGRGSTVTCIFPSQGLLDSGHSPDAAQPEADTKAPPVSALPTVSGTKPTEDLFSWPAKRASGD